MLFGFLFWGISLAVLFALLHYSIRTWFLPTISDETTTMMTWAAYRLGGLHGFVVAFVFANVASFGNEVHLANENEAIALARLSRSLSLHETPDTRTAKQHLAAYVDALGTEKGVAVTTAAFTELEKAVFKSIGNPLVATARNSIEESFLAADLARSQRKLHAPRGIPAPIWIFAIVGFVGTSVTFLAFRATPSAMAFIALYAALNGFVFFVFWSAGNPALVDTGQITAEAFVVLSNP